MKTLTFHTRSYEYTKLLLAIAVGTITWFMLPILFNQNPLAGFVDVGIWQLILLAIISWLIILCVAHFVMKTFLASLNMPSLSSIVKLFKTLTPWEQLIIYLLVYALLLLSAIAALIAIC